MDWDLTLEKLRQESFRPTIPPPVRMPRWAVAALLGAGLTLSGAGCDRGGTGNSEPVADMGPVRLDASIAVPVDSQPGKPDEKPAEMPPEPPPMTDPAPIESLPPMLEEMKIAPMILTMVAPAYGIPVMRRTRLDPSELPAPMYAGPQMNSQPTVRVTGLVPGDAPIDVKKVLQGFPFAIGSCFRQAASKGVVGKTGDLAISVKVADGRITILILGGSLAGTEAMAECVKNRINYRNMGSSDEARAYSRNWTFSVQIIASASE